MANRKPILIDGVVTEVDTKATLRDILPPHVDLVQRLDGALIPRERFASTPVPAGFQTHLSEINKGASRNSAPSDQDNAPFHARHT